ncbi:MAG: hypothetical protein DWQ33_02805 [Bacteroidetes bacterium]|nr:MAG: hypothetical protein DWQ33_02805 [Bacteroidota bacterium]
MQQEIQHINSLLEQAKAKIKKGVSIKKSVNDVSVREYQEFNPLYARACQIRDKIAVHAEGDEFPEHLFVVRAPRMTKDEFDYIKSNYKNETRPVYLDFFNTVMRIFHDSNWSIDWPSFDEDGNPLAQYMENLPIYGSEETFTRDIVTHAKLTDAMGVIVVKPRTIKTIKNDQGEEVIDNRERFEPLPYYFRCDQVLFYEEGEYYFLLSDEKSEVDYGGRKSKEGVVFEYHDKNHFYRIEQYGRKSDYNFRVIHQYSHNWNRVTVHRLKGVPRVTKDGVLHVSPFYFAVDILDLVTLNATNLQTIINNAAYPYRIVYGDECDFQITLSDNTEAACNGGKIFNSDLNATITCPSCNGSGLKSRLSPLGVMIIRAPSTEFKGDAELKQDPIKWVEPSTNQQDFLKKKIASDEIRARKIIPLHTGNSEASAGPDLATKMVLDLKALYAFLKPISDQIFDLKSFIICASGWIRYAEESKKMNPVISYPVSYDFKTETDYISQISEAIKAGLPPMVIHSIMFRFLQSLYYNEKRTADVFSLIVSADRLLVFDSQTIQSKIRDGLAEKWESVLHDSAIIFVNEMLIAEPEFFDKYSPEERKEKLIEAAKKKAADIEAARKASAGASAQSRVNEILN